MEEMEPDIEVPLLQQDVFPPEVADEIGIIKISMEDAAAEGSFKEYLPNELGVESLDYDPIHSVVASKLRKIHRRRHLYGYTGLTLAKWAITIFVGLLVGCVAYTIESSQELIITHKKNWTQKIIQKSVGLAFFICAIFGISLVLLSSCLVLFWAPAAAGGGVTLVMAYLNGNDIPNFFRLSTLVTKILGTICTISSGFPIGQEGPMVHIGAAIASVLTWMHGDLVPPDKDNVSGSRLCFGKQWLKALPFDFHNDRDRREFISAGTAAGLAAAFGSPIGGVLFSLEEASSFWSRKVMWRSLVCTAVATMTLSLLHEREFFLALPGNLSFHGLQPEFVFQDLPLFMVTSAGAAILGALVNIAHGWLANVRPPTAHRLSRIAEACLVTFISVALMFVMPLWFGRCLQVPEGQESTKDMNYWFKYTCLKENHGSGVALYNDLATLFFSVPHQTIRKLLQLGQGVPSYFTIRSLGIYATSFILLFILAYGIATPGGIFMPSMMVGASFGAFLGCIYRHLFPRGHVQPGLHALVGAAAMLGGVFRASISLVVIMVEATGGIDFILPIIISIVVSNWVAHHIHHAGAYEADLERLGNVSFLQSEPPHKLLALTATDIMAPNVIGFEEIVPVTEAVNVLRKTKHNGFPVFRSTESDRPGDGKFLGLILRHQLLLLLEQHAFLEVDSAILRQRRSQRIPYFGKNFNKELEFLDHAMHIYHHCHHPHRRDLSSRPEVIDGLGLDYVCKPLADSSGHYSLDNNSKHHQADEPEKMLALDLRPFMNRAPLTVRGECSAQRVFVIFRTLGLRHLCVTDSNNRVIGMITRKDIVKAQRQAREQPWERYLSHVDSDLRSFTERGNKDIIYYLP